MILVAALAAFEGSKLGEFIGTIPLIFHWLGKCRVSISESTCSVLFMPRALSPFSHPASARRAVCSTAIRISAAYSTTPALDPFGYGNN